MPRIPAGLLDQRITITVWADRRSGDLATEKRWAMVETGERQTTETLGAIIPSGQVTFTVRRDTFTLTIRSKDKVVWDGFGYIVRSVTQNKLNQTLEIVAIQEAV